MTAPFISDSPMHRLFLAHRPPEPIVDTLVDLTGGGESLRWQSDEQLHLTLRFIGPVERPLAEDLAQALARFRFDPVEIRLSGVGRFARTRGGALWAGIAPRDPLAQLAARLDRLCQAQGLEAERRAYHPHITLARWSGREPDLAPWLQTHAALASTPWPLDTITLYESHLSQHGAHYEAVAEFRAGNSIG